MKKVRRNRKKGYLGDFLVKTIKLMYTNLISESFAEDNLNFLDFLEIYFERFINLCKQ